jgi:hypothetical protein
VGGYRESGIADSTKVDTPETRIGAVLARAPRAKETAGTPEALEGDRGIG